MGDIITRTLKSGRAAYYARYVEADGKRTSRATKARTLEDAQKVLWALEERVKQGQVGLAVPTKEERAKRIEAAKRAQMTVKQLGEIFCREYSSPKLKDPTRYRKDAESTFKVRVNDYAVASIAVAALTAGDLETWRDRLIADKYAPHSVKLTFATLSKAINWARKRGLVSCGNPTTGVDLPERQHTIDYLSKEEVAKLLDYAERKRPDLYPMIATGLYTGMRKGELFGLRWTDVHLDAGRIDVMRSYELAPKSGKPRYLPLHPELARILRSWNKACPATAEGLVFPVSGRMGRRYKGRAFDAVLRRAGCHVPAKPWHGLRHTFASHFMMAGGSILTLRELLGHADIKMTMIYAHLAPDYMANEVARMSFAIPKAGVADMGEERRKRSMDTQRKTGANEADTATA